MTYGGFKPRHQRVIGEPNLYAHRVSRTLSLEYNHYFLLEKKEKFESAQSRNLEFKSGVSKTARICPEKLVFPYNAGFK